MGTLVMYGLLICLGDRPGGQETTDRYRVLGGATQQACWTTSFGFLEVLMTMECWEMHTVWTWRTGHGPRSVTSVGTWMLEQQLLGACV